MYQTLKYIFIQVPLHFLNKKTILAIQRGTIFSFRQGTFVECHLSHAFPVCISTEIKAPMTKSDFALSDPSPQRCGGGPG